MNHNPGYTTTDPAETPMFINEESSLTIIIGQSMFSRKFKAFNPLVRETRDGQTRELGAADTPGRTGGGLIPLYVGDKSED